MKLAIIFLVGFTSSISLIAAGVSPVTMALSGLALMAFGGYRQWRLQRRIKRNQRLMLERNQRIDAIINRWQSMRHNED